MKARYAFLIIPILMAAGAIWLMSRPGAGTPRVLLQDLSHLPITIVAPYDEGADADAKVEAAFARARESGKRVMIVLGGNWCPDCIILANVSALPEVASWLDRHFERVSVDVGRFDRNLQIPARFGITDRLKGVPTVLVATPEGKLINPQDPFTLANSTTMTPQSIVNWLGTWVTPRG